jgi:hypothetical protein
MVTDEYALCQWESICLRQSLEDKIRGCVLGKKVAFSFLVRKRYDLAIGNLFFQG